MQIEKRCLNCNKIFKINQAQINRGKGKFCCKKCLYDWLKKAHKGEGNSQWRGGKIKRICKICGRGFKVAKYRIKRDPSCYCSLKCVGIANGLKNKGKKCPKEIREKIRKSLKGRRTSIITEETRRKMGAARRGAKNPQWRGGLSFEPYSPDWTKSLKLAIRKRDNYTCQIGKEKENGHSFDVHHIDYNKKNCDPINLITLCRKCHRKTNDNREYWQQVLSKKALTFAPLALEKGTK